MSELVRFPKSTPRVFYGSGNDAFCYEYNSSNGYRVPYEPAEILTIMDFLGQCVAYLVRQRKVSACVVRLNTADLLLAREGSCINALHVVSKVRTDARDMRGQPIVSYKQHKFFAPDDFMDTYVAPALGGFDFGSEQTARIAEIMTGAQRMMAFSDQRQKRKWYLPPDDDAAPARGGSRSGA